MVSPPLSYQFHRFFEFPRIRHTGHGSLKLPTIQHSSDATKQLKLWSAHSALDMRAWQSEANWKRNFLFQTSAKEQKKSIFLSIVRLKRCIGSKVIALRISVTDRRSEGQSFILDGLRCRPPLRSGRKNALDTRRIQPSSTAIAPPFQFLISMPTGGKLGSRQSRPN